MISCYITFGGLDVHQTLCFTSDLAQWKGANYKNFEWDCYHK